jgi:hypothetical protein
VKVRWMSSQRQKYVIAHFDGHGVSTAAARARSMRIPPERVYSKYPTTSPEQLPNYIDTYFPTLSQHDVEIIDIPVNLKNPAQYIDAINRLAMNTPVTMYDHHATDKQYLNNIIARVIYFSDAVAMAESLSNSENLELAMVGVVADRDPSINRVLSQHEVECCYLPLANRLDVIVRRDAEAAVKTLISTADPIHYIASIDAQYPPESLARQATIIRKGTYAVLVDLTKLPREQITQWSWKTLEQLAIVARVDYVVAIAESFDRQTNQYVPTVQVIKYWLSNMPSPKKPTETVLGRTTIGHDDAFSVRAVDINDARSVAETIFNNLENVPASKMTRLINESSVAESLRSDFNTILSLLTRILQQQSEMYREYLDLKKKQVELLERLSQQPQQPQQQQRRSSTTYD